MLIPVVGEKCHELNDWFYHWRVQKGQMLVLPSNATGFSLRQGNNEPSIVEKSYQTKSFSKIIQRKLRSKTISNTRSGKRANKKIISNMLVFAGTNPEGAISEWPTRTKIIGQSNACLWIFQKTKCSQPNKL